MKITDCFGASFEELRGRITDVRYGVYWVSVVNDNPILFKFGGNQYRGLLRGRNVDLVLGAGLEIDAAVAVRVLLDGDAVMS